LAKDSKDDMGVMLPVDAMGRHQWLLAVHEAYGTLSHRRRLRMDLRILLQLHRFLLDNRLLGSCRYRHICFISDEI